MENVHKKYQKQLLDEGTVKEDDLKKLQSHVSGIMSSEFEAARQYKPEVCSRFNSLSLLPQGSLGTSYPFRATYIIICIMCFLCTLAFHYFLRVPNGNGTE